LSSFNHLASPETILGKRAYKNKKSDGSHHQQYNDQAKILKSWVNSFI
jgi:hypothetical protein